MNTSTNTTITRYDRRFFILRVNRGWIAVEDKYVRNGKLITDDRGAVKAFNTTEKGVINTLIDTLDYEYLRKVKGYSVAQAMRVVYHPCSGE